MSTESVIQEILQERQNQIERGYDTVGMIPSSIASGTWSS